MSKKRIRKLRKYIRTKPFENINLSISKGGRPIEWTKEAIKEEKDALEKWMLEPKNYFFTSFLNERGLHATEIARLIEVDKEFCDTVRQAKQIQEQRLVDLGVTRKGDGNFIKFVLQNKAGWKDKTEISGDAQNPLAFIFASTDGRSKELIEDQPLEGEVIDDK